MGIPFFASFIYDYLLQSTDHLKQINLTKQNVIIDGNSFMYFIYNRIVKEDKKKQMSQRLTGTPFGYDGCWKIFSETLSLFKKKCSTVIVVFDGISKSNPYKRSDPNRVRNSSFSIDEEQEVIPTLLRRELLNILRELKIKIIMACGEADSVVVKIAKEQNAYIVSYDSDYHLYQLSHGFVSLRYLNLETLTGPTFQLADVFGNIGPAGAALWATIIANKFVTFDELRASCPINSVADRKKFRQWLEKTKSDGDKSEWTTSQLSVLRFIQKVGTIAAYNQLIKEDFRLRFNQIMNRYINVQQEISLNTQNGNYLSPVIEQRFIDGKFDRKLIEILINRELPTRWQGLSSIQYRLLLSICHILLRWNDQNREIANFNAIIIFKEQQYHLFNLMKSEDIPLLNDISDLSKNDRRNYVLHCIGFALEHQAIDYWNEVNEDYVLWLSLLKLWYREQDSRTSFVQPILQALIVSFLKHILLDTYDEDERGTSSEPLSSPYLQYSPQKLKNQFSLEACALLREEIDRYSETILLNEFITSALCEVEQLYDHLAIINQFFDYPLPMPAPHKCINQLTYRLAVVFSTSKNIFKDISSLFYEYPFLVNMTEKIEVFVCNS